MEEPRQITRSQYLKAIALLHLAQSKRKEMDELAQEIGTTLEIVPDECGDYGHVSDAIFEDYTIKQFMRKQNLILTK